MSADEVTPPAETRGLRSLLRTLGPGLITGAADDDPSGIGTHSQVGAEFGYGSGGSGLAYQLGAGVKFAVSDHVDIDLGYRFKGLSNINFPDRDRHGNYNGATLNSHNIQLGVTYRF